MRTEWQDPDDSTACPNRVPSMHDWRKSMPYTGPDGLRVNLWLCAACGLPMAGAVATVREHTHVHLLDPGNELRCVVCSELSPSLGTGTRPT